MIINPVHENAARLFRSDPFTSRSRTHSTEAVLRAQALDVDLSLESQGLREDHSKPLVMVMSMRRRCRASAGSCHEDVGTLDQPIQQTSALCRTDVQPYAALVRFGCSIQQLKPSPRASR